MKRVLSFIKPTISALAILGLIVSMLIRLGGVALNTLGDGKYPRQTLTATVLGFERFTHDCHRIEGNGAWTCDYVASTEVRPYAEWAMPITAPIACWFGTLAELVLFCGIYIACASPVQKKKE